MLAPATDAYWRFVALAGRPSAAAAAQVLRRHSRRLMAGARFFSRAGSAAAPVVQGDDQSGKEKKKFAGTWALTSGEVDGKAVADEHVKASKLTVDGDK